MNNGFINEEVLREYINNNSFNTYNNNIKDFLSFVFGSKLNTELSFKAEKKAGQVKPDLCIKHNGIEKYISIKKGTGNSVHQECIDVFFPYINSLINATVLNNLKIFHYGDGTTNDTGAIRYSAEECKIKYSEEVKTLNTELNKWSNLSNFLDRFLFIGNVGTLAIDIVYHGEITSGFWASKNEIINYVRNNSFDTNAVHFGPLTYQVWGRNEKKNSALSRKKIRYASKMGQFKKRLISNTKGE